MTGDAVPSTRLTSQWAARLSLAFIVLSLAALIIFPRAIARRIAPLQNEMTSLAEPGRGLVSQIHLAMAQQGSALDDFVDDRDPMFLAHYEAAKERELRAYAQLIPLLDRLGAEPRQRLADLRTLETRWHRAAEVYGGTTPKLISLRHDRAQEDLYDATLIAAAGLDESITQAIRDRRSQVAAGQATQEKVSSLLELLALAAVVVTWRLGHRVRMYAIAAEERRAALAEATASRARFMRGVSHDLKNPIHAIDGHAQLLEMELRGPLTADQRDSIARIRRSVRSLTRLIEDLLDLARAESGQLPIALERVVLHDLVHETVEEHRAAAEAAHLELVYAPDGADVGLVSDPARVGQVLGNLLSNAIKYTPANGRIDVSVARLPSPGPNMSGSAMAIHVDDDGPGIPPDKREEIFAEFTRLRPEAGPGAGLGLSIARRIARMLGGDVTVSAPRARGSRFTLWLPIDSLVNRSHVSDPAQQTRVRRVAEIQPVPRDLEPAVVDQSSHTLSELLHEPPAGKHV